METSIELSGEIGSAPACEAVGVPRATFYRVRGKGSAVTAEVRAEASEGARSQVRAASIRALSEDERQEVIRRLNSERFVDQAPREVYASLLDEGEYLCSVRTMYRVLEEAGEARERRDQVRHPAYQKPELLAKAPNEVWSWDITKLLGPVKWSYFYLYVILDIFSRYVVGWMVAEGESEELAEKLIAETCHKQGIEPGRLTLHADRGSSMKSKLVAHLLDMLGVTKTHSRPQVSDDNPYSEAQFKTLKYSPEFPERFGSLQDALSFCREFFTWYNEQHHHTGIALLTPKMAHYGEAAQVIEARDQVLRAAYEAHPERFVRGLPKAPRLPEAVWINPPAKIEAEQEAAPLIVTV
jgi:putative transposase